jgi:hypothetical protein
VSYIGLDRQLARFSRELVTDIHLTEKEASKVATLVASEMRFLDHQSKAQIIGDGPVPIRARLDELRAYQRWTEIAFRTNADPAIVRAQVITQLYVCFVYLGEACFRVLRSVHQPGSVTRRCCKYLTDNPVRAFRNSIAHSNWLYAEDYSGLIYWARKGSEPDEPLSRFEVSQDQLDFWQSLARGVAYAAYTELDGSGPIARVS